MTKNQYKAAHHRVNKLRGQPRKCEHCGTTSAKRYEWASKTKNYNDPQDYIRLCRRCHMKFDDIGKNILKFHEKFKLGKVVRRCVCGIRFKARSNSHKFCSSICYKRSKNDSRRTVYKPKTLGLTVTCRFRRCGKKFKQNKNWQKFCSFSCQQKQLILSRREKRK